MSEANKDEIRQAVLAVLRKIAADLDCPPPRRVPHENAPSIFDQGQPFGPPPPGWGKTA